MIFFPCILLYFFFFFFLTFVCFFCWLMMADLFKNQKSNSRYTTMAEGIWTWIEDTLSVRNNMSENDYTIYTNNKYKIKRVTKNTGKNRKYIYINYLNDFWRVSNEIYSSEVFLFRILYCWVCCKRIDFMYGTACNMLFWIIESKKERFPRAFFLRYSSSSWNLFQFFLSNCWKWHMDEYNENEESTKRIVKSNNNVKEKRRKKNPRNHRNVFFNWFQHFEICHHHLWSNWIGSEHSSRQLVLSPRSVLIILYTHYTMTTGFFFWSNFLLYCHIF